MSECSRLAAGGRFGVSVCPLEYCSLPAFTVPTMN